MRTIRAAVLGGTALASIISVQSAIAADLAVAPPVVPVVRHWDGLYASFSAGGTWTTAKESLSETGVDTNTQNFFGAFPSTFTSSGPFNTVDSQTGTGNRAGAVFTFAMGYNVVWSNWLAGIQSEVSLNRNNSRLQGTSLTTSNQTQVQTFNGLAPVTSTTTSSSTFTEFSSLENKWTISEMARLGYLVAPDWLVYGLIGWSWAGFEWNQFGDVRPFTLGGITYGAGVEKDFGWLRAFVQYKGINFDSKGIDVSNPNSQQQTQSQAGVITATFSNNNTDAATRRFSADVHQITAGLTIPINFTQWIR